MDDEDTIRLKINDGKIVCPENNIGNVVVTAWPIQDKSHAKEQRRIAVKVQKRRYGKEVTVIYGLSLGFMKNGSCSNQLIGADSIGHVITEFRALKVRVSVSKMALHKSPKL